MKDTIIKLIEDMKDKACDTFEDLKGDTLDILAAYLITNHEVLSSAHVMHIMKCIAAYTALNYGTEAIQEIESVFKDC